VRVNMENKQESVKKICFNVGPLRNGFRRWVKIHLISNQKDNTVQPSRVEKHPRTKERTEIFRLPLGTQYLVEETLIKKHRSYSSQGILVIDRQGNVNIRNWDGSFPLQFSVIE